MSIREIDFVDGLNSGTNPDNTGLEGDAIGIKEFANIAAYETYIGRGAEAGDIFYNTSTNKGQYYNGSAWVELVDSSTDLSDHEALSIAHGTTGQIVGKSDSQSISNKQFTTGNKLALSIKTFI